MKCPECGKPTDVIDTRSRGDGGVRRRRRCFNQHKFTTIELPVQRTKRQLADLLTQAAKQIRSEK